MAKQEQVKAEAKPAELTLEQLKAKVAEAIASGNDTDFMVAVSTIAKRKSEMAKAQAESARKEAEALAGTREKTAIILFKLMQQVPGLKKALESVKAHGFTYTLDEPDAQNVMVIHKSVSLSVPTIKSKRVGGGTGGASGKSKAEFGMSLGEIFDKFATDEDKAKLSEATSNSSQWQVKVAVKKRAIEAGLLKPVA